MTLRYDGSWCLVFAIAPILLGGCARYEFALVEPNRFAGTIGTEGLRVSYEPLEYRLAKKDNRLAMIVSNPTDKPVTLVAKKSYVVDPGGQTQPLDSGMIAPRSYVVFVLPPEPPVYHSGPTFSFGLGVGHSYGSGPYFGSGVGYAFHDSPGYLENAPYYWEWKKGQVRMRLSYEESSTNTFEHDFVFLRQKATK